MTQGFTRRAARILLRVAVCAACLSGARIAWSATPDDCQALRKHGRRAEAAKCYESLTAARDPFTRAEGFWGLEQYEEANNQFRMAVQQSPAQLGYGRQGRARW